MTKKRDTKTNREKLSHLLDLEWNKIKNGDANTPYFNGEDLKQQIIKKVESRRIRKNTVIRSLKIAATVAILVAISGTLFYMINQKPSPQLSENATMMEHYAAPGNQLKVTLPDGSQVHLNNASTIRYPKEFGPNNRLIELEGEAFFDVQRDTTRPFIVNSNGVKTQVFGTSFNVTSYNSEKTVVTVATGKVSVSLIEEPEIEAVILNPGNQSICSSTEKTLIKREVDVSEFLAWRSLILNFNGITLCEAVKRMERWYNIEMNIADEALCSRIIHGSYKNESLRNVLKSLEFIHGIRCEIIDNKITIYSE